jgi:hypothetical protein
MQKRLTLALAVAGLVCVGAAQAETMVIQAGYNFLTTAPGSRVPITLPAGFFGTKNGVESDPIYERLVPLVGRPIGSLGLSPRSNLQVGAGQCHGEGGNGEWHCHEDSAQLQTIDTITRVSGATLESVGSTARLALQFVALSLQTPDSKPVEVTYGGENPEYYRMVLKLDPGQTQDVGSIDVTRTSGNGGSMVVVLPVKFQATFSGSGSQSPLGPVPLQAVLESNDNTFTLRP